MLIGAALTFRSPDDVLILDVDPYADEVLADPFPLHAAVRAKPALPSSCRNTASNLCMPRRRAADAEGLAPLLPPPPDPVSLTSAVLTPGARRARSRSIRRVTHGDPQVAGSVPPRLIKSLSERFCRWPAHCRHAEVPRLRPMLRTDPPRPFCLQDLFPAAIGWPTIPSAGRSMPLGALNFDGQGAA